MSLKYESTRDNRVNVRPSEAVVKGLSDDGGLFVPREIDGLGLDIKEMCSLNFHETAKKVLSLFFTDFSEEQINDSVMKAYDSKFDDPEIVPVKKVGETYIMELFHGSTIAFKDIALSILPHLMKKAQSNCRMKEEIVILTATSGDTGKAALEGFKDVEGTQIIVFYPNDGVSKVQEMQMLTTDGANTHVVAVEGNFDDAQSAVKAIFNDQDLRAKLSAKGMKFSSANSINIGRLVPQISYYFSTYADMVKKDQIKLGDKINFVIPTGNFGNILAGYFAKTLGLPVGKLICAANENNVLYDFLNTGVYDINRDFKKTMSPSMDILISSNLERLLYFMSDKDNAYVAELMDQLKKNKKYEVTDEIKAKIKDQFWSSYCSESDTSQTVKKVYEEEGYLLDTHTAVAYKVYEDYVKATDDESKSVILSTASPFKFTGSVYKALFGQTETDELNLIAELSHQTGIEVPKQIEGLGDRKILHKRFCRPQTMPNEILNILDEK
ncbi:threonine synthase [Fusibacter sp. 3D3]|uniref:threonine synthase n=1 Tax=Fusibacter sp. 3D3 TaxID=1048380 RepID=UPI000853D509|nr:threonine synthase [Fusibacter sp. 3D3]GAU76417.1 threonine synthase [Fusibacter sp. 3D3]